MEAIENFIDDIPPQLALKLASSLAFQPVEVTKVLIQLGHEPMPLVKTKTFFGKPALKLPNVFQYMGYIRRKEGLSGLWRGCSPRLSSLLVQYYAAEKFDELYPPELELTESEEEKLTEEQRLKRFGRETARCLANRTLCVILSQPLQVIAVRAIAEFIGGEDKYTGDWTGGIVSGIISSIKDNGILSLWSGLQPRLLGELLLVAATNTLNFTVSTYILKGKNKEMKTFSDQVVNYIAQSLTYPFSVVGNCMIVSNSGLRAGYPPCMNFYMNWTDCYAHLRSQNQLKRGSSLFIRYYSGPQVIVGDEIMPLHSKPSFKAPSSN